MTEALIAGLLVGLSAAVFVAGAAMTVMETAIRRGLSVALAGGIGIAAGDAVWAAVAAAAGAAISQLFAPWATALQWAAIGVIGVLLVLAVRELIRPEPPAPVAELPGSPLRAYGVFLLHTLGNPVTAVYFLSIILGAAPRYGAAESSAFVAGVFLASLSWQWILATAGALRRRTFSGRARRGVLALDCVLLALLIAYIALGVHRR